MRLRRYNLCDHMIEGLAKRMLREDSAMRVSALAVLVGLFGMFPTIDPCRADCIDYSDYLHCTGSATLPCAAYSVDVAGDYAYVADRNCGLVIVDVTDPLIPMVVGTANGQAYAEDVVVSGEYAYLVGGYEFQVIDISDPLSPSIVARLDEGWSGSGVAVSGTYAYVAAYDFQAGLWVIDISDPRNPTSVASGGCSQALELAVSGNYAYIVGVEGLCVVDITDPRIPRVVGNLSTPSAGCAIAVSGSHAYVSDGEDPEAFWVVDITEPGNPRLVGELPLDGGGGGVVVADNIAYVSSYDSCAPGGSFYVIDVTDPENPRTLGRTYAGGATDVAVSGHHAYVSDGGGYLHVIDITHSESPPVTGSVQTPDLALGVEISGNHAIVWECGRVQAVDITDPRNPRIVGNVDISAWFAALAVSGDHAYLVGQDLGGYCRSLEVIDISNPQDLRIVGTVMSAEIPYCITVSGTFAYVAGNDRAGAGFLQVIDISNPEDPRIIATVHTPNDGFGVAVSGDFVYVQEVSIGLRVFDVSDPHDPRLVGELEISDAWPSIYQGMGCVAVTGSHAYLLGRDSRFQVIDISNPQHPRAIACVPVLASGGSPPPGIAVSGNTVYLAGDDCGVQVVDVGDPLRPRYLGSIHTGVCGDVAVSDDHIYIASWESGLQVGSKQCERSPGSSEGAESVPALDLAVSPSPASGRASLQLTLPVRCTVRAAVYDIMGRKVRTLHDGELPAGRHDLRWNGRDEMERKVAPGVYLTRLATAEGTRTARVVMLQ